MHLLRSILAGLLLVALEKGSVAAPKEQAARLWEKVAFERHRGRIVGLEFSADGKTLISAYCGDGTIRLWDVASGKNTATFEHSPERRVRNLWGMAVSPDGKTVASCEYNTIELWDVASGKKFATFKSDQEPYRMVFGPDGKTISAIETNGLRVWDVAKRKELRFCKLRCISVTTYRCTKRPVLAVRTGIRDESFTLIDAVTGESVLACAGHKGGRVGCFALDREETMVASSGSDQTVRLWDRTSGAAIAVIDHPPAMTYCLAFSPDRQILVSAYQCDHRKMGRFGIDGGFRLYEVPSGEVLDEEKHSYAVTSLAFSPDGRLLATGDLDGVIKLWTIPAAWRKAKK